MEVKIIENLASKKWIVRVIYDDGKTKSVSFSFKKMGRSKAYKAAKRHANSLREEFLNCPQRNNVSGRTGVCYFKNHKKWTAFWTEYELYGNGKIKRYDKIEFFDYFDDACKRRQEIELNWLYTDEYRRRKAKFQNQKGRFGKKKEKVSPYKENQSMNCARRNNVSGKIGVFFSNDKWIATWINYYLNDNNIIKRKFKRSSYSIGRYGYRKAYKLACQEREWVENNILLTNRYIQLKKMYQKGQYTSQQPSQTVQPKSSKRKNARLKDTTQKQRRLPIR